MNFEISHRTVYRYSSPVSQSYYLLHLEPRPHQRQTVSHYSLTAGPAPASKTDLVDGFGNPAAIIAIERDHTELVIHSQAVVDVEAPEEIKVRHPSSWNDVAAHLRGNLGAETFEAIVYSCASRYIQPSRELYKFVRPSFPDGRPLLEGVRDLTSRIHQTFTYQGGFTDAATPVDEVLRFKRGACHDFAHVEIACLRTLGLAARYVSGYLLKQEPKGAPKRAGDDASHAWVSVWAPETGWVDFDPANNISPAEGYITVAVGRDFQDACPISGVLVGGGESEVEVAVEVNCVSADTAETR